MATWYSVMLKKKKIIIKRRKCEVVMKPFPFDHSNILKSKHNRA